MADLLGFAPEAMQIASFRGLLFCATCRDGHRSFVVTDSRKLSAAAFRLDGKPWERSKRFPQILPGSMEGWPIGIGEAAQFPAIALVCSGIDLLAALHLSWGVAREDIIAPVAIMPPAGDIADAIADMALTPFKGKVVCLFPHSGTPQEVGEHWSDQLHEAGALEVETYSFDGLLTNGAEPVQCLRGFVRVNVDQWDGNQRDAIESAFSFGPEPQALHPQHKRN